MQKLARQLKNEKGFTLVELMTVVAIIGILVLIAVPVYRNVITNAEKNACQANQRTLESAWLVYQAEGKQGEWPEDYIAGAVADAVGKITLQEMPTDDCAYTITEGVVSCEVDKHNRGYEPSQTTE